jgi:succinate dehydrogenase hydrophobic anchor subunit
MSESQPDGSEARSYHRWQFRLGALGILLTAGYLAALLATSAAAHLRDLLAARTHHWWLAVPSALLILGTCHQLLALPVSWLGGFWLPRRFGLHHQRLVSGLWDRAWSGWPASTSRSATPTF